VRRRPPAARAQQGQAASAAGLESAEPSSQPSDAEAETPKAPAGAPPTTYARLFVSVGKRDGARPGDLVGAIAGESGIPGGKIGRIEIRDTFSIVEVEADVAERVVRAVNGTTIKGRAARVDYDRDRVAPPRPSGARRPRPDGRPREAQ
jgi:ATP-dependent RNA helicase DeaD